MYLQFSKHGRMAHVIVVSRLRGDPFTKKQNELFLRFG